MEDINGHWKSFMMPGEFIFAQVILFSSSAFLYFINVFFFKIIGRKPFHRLQDRNVVPLSVGIVRSDARGSKTVNLQGSQAVQALQACARRTVPLWVGPTEKAYAPEDGSVYHVTVAGEKNGKYDELCNVTVDGKGFIHANSSRYHLVGDSWRDAVEAVFQMGEALEMEGRL